MKVDEGVTLAKMAIVVMLVVLVLSATFTLFYFIYQRSIRAVSTTEETMRKANYEKVLELDNQSRVADGGTGSYPLVTNVVAVLSELRDYDFIYTSITDGSDTSYYTYNGVTLSGVMPSAIKYQGDVPDAETVVKLMQYSGKRCMFYVNDVNVGGLDFKCIDIIIIP